MVDAKSAWMLAGGLWLAMAAWLPAVAQEVPLPPAEPAAAEPAVPATASLSDSAVCVECAPSGGILSRWYRRHVARAQEKYWGYPEEFEDAPLGLMVNSHIATSVASGYAARMVLYQYDFYPGTDQLKPRGKQQVKKIASWLPLNQFPVFVEPSGQTARLDEARRQAVWRELADAPYEIPLERVIIGYGASRGLGGLEAQAVDRNRLSQTTARGAAGGVGGGGGVDAGFGAGSVTTGTSEGSEGQSP